ncbi:hypothetical protein [Microbacterium sp.]|uniref:hypothetical protein n=1 Tax=Microbacterium sp. TaxID=51671 RepID=UPI002810A55F|nr:hypothetical protein [Microbacterium sp.]
MDSILYLVFALAYAVLFFWMIALTLSRRRIIASDLAALVVAALVYDNAVLAVGALVGEGEGLRVANGLRFWMHAFATPLLVIVGWHAMSRAGIRWAARGWAAAAAVALSAVLIAWELATSTLRMELVAETEYGAVSYSDAAAPAGPPVMALIVVAVLLLAGILVWIRQKWPWLTVAAVVMVAGISIPLPVQSGAVTNAFELLLLIGVVATIGFQDGAEPAPAPTGLGRLPRSAGGTARDAGSPSRADDAPRMRR